MAGMDDRAEYLDGRLALEFDVTLVEFSCIGVLMGLTTDWDVLGEGFEMGERVDCCSLHSIVRSLKLIMGFACSNHGIPRMQSYP